MTETEAAAIAVLDRYIAALNARDAEALADTLHFPHYRLTQGRVQCWETPDSYHADFLARAGDGWHHSAWDFRRPVAASPDKVHLDVQFTRYRADGSSMGAWCADQRSRGNRPRTLQSRLVSLYGCESAPKWDPLRVLHKLL